MNVMAEAHKNTKLFFEVQPLSSFTYAQVFSDYLKQAHKEYKAMQANKAQPTIKLDAVASTLANDYFDATGYSVTGQCVDSEGQEVYVSYSSGSEMACENEAAYYLDSSNGFKNVDLTLTLHGCDGSGISFKIVR